jgi:hypothetical protein
MLIWKDFLKRSGCRNPHFFHLIFSPNHHFSRALKKRRVATIEAAFGALIPSLAPANAMAFMTVTLPA